MVKDGKIWMSKNDTPQFMCPSMANRHGLIAGATGTGKTITLKVMAESFSALGVPVFLADIKGDLSGMCQPGKESEDMAKRIAKFGIENWTYTSFPTRFFDIFGKNGHPVRTTVSEMGPILLSRLLGLTAVQEGVLNIVFRVADDNGLLLIDLKDLKAMLNYVSEHREEYTLTYGNVSPQSAGAIQRSLLALESQGGDLFFGEPALDFTDWITTDEYGRGMINILDSTELVQSPLLYATFMLWMLTELFEKLPEVGDADKPKLVFFFDEAHLLFRDMPKTLNQKIEQVVKLIRSKGVGVYFISQSPSDIPDEVLAQLGNRVQHALRAYTPAEQKAVRTAAQTFRQNPAFDTSTAIMEMGVGEALVSFLDEDGIPSMVERTFILPPQSLMGPVDALTRNAVITRSPLDEKYGTPVDNRSAYEELTEQDAAEEAAELKAKEDAAAAKQKAKDDAAAAKQKQKEEAAALKKKEKEEAAKKKKQEKFIDKTVGRMASSAFGAIGRQIGNSIIRGLFGNSK
ncbi:MAG: DUF853 family protein [Lachnospiraceae bacterium]|nr:DUF853 family protein [Lachnospiraceae bacterium]